MAQVKVWNDNEFDHVEEFKGDKVTIPAGKFVLMNSDEAVQFLGQYFPVKRDVNGQGTKASYKMLRLTPHETAEGDAKDETPKVDPLKCVACAYKASGAADFKEHMKTHADALVVDEEAEREIKKRKRAG